MPTCPNRPQRKYGESKRVFPPSMVLGIWSPAPCRSSLNGLLARRGFLLIGSAAAREPVLRLSESRSRYAATLTPVRPLCKPTGHRRYQERGRISATLAYRPSGVRTPIQGPEPADSHARPSPGFLLDACDWRLGIR